MLIRSTIFSAIVITLSLTTSAEEKIPDTIDFYGTTAENGCLAKSLAQLRESTYAAAGEHNPALAWSLVQAVVCGKSRKTNKFLLRHMPRKLQTTSFATGNLKESYSLVNRSNASFFGGRAWGVTVESGATTLSVNAQTNEACVGSVTLTHYLQSWLITAYSDACD